VRRLQRERNHRRREAGISRFNAPSQQPNYLARMEAQGGVCAVCGKAETAKDPAGRIKRLAIDHDHTTGRTRGLLCQRCNTALGLLGDDWRRAQKLSDYLATFAGLAILDAAVAHVAPAGLREAVRTLDEAIK
jgi:hypothetical protein